LNSQLLTFYYLCPQNIVVPAHTVKALNFIPNLDWVPLDNGICLKATLLMKEYLIDPFNAYHAARADSTKIPHARLRSVPQKAHDFSRGINEG